MSLLNFILDTLLCGILVVMASGALRSQNLFRAIILFIVYGLMMALTWSRLSAPDVAIAEAAIGAGLTGVLLLSSAQALQRRDLPTRSFRWPLALLTAVFGGLIFYSLLTPPLKDDTTTPNLSVLVQHGLQDAGVAQPVTAVLLNFRGFDTWIELTVLLAALFGSWMHVRRAYKASAATEIVLTRFTRILTPFAILIGFYFLWAGTHRPGGAFQAGAIFGAIGTLYILNELRLPLDHRLLVYRFTAMTGFLAFTLLAAWSLIRLGSVLRYPPEYAGSVILLVEFFSMAAIGLTLLSLFFLAGKGSSTS